MTERHLYLSGLESKETSERQCFTKADRLLERAEFVHLATNATRVSDRRFIAFFEAGKQQRTRIGITVSRKVGNAVTRNRIKRLVREFFRVNRLLYKRPLDIHIIAKRETADGCSQAIFLSLGKLFRRIESRNHE